MTHDNKMKFWFFYTKEDQEDPNSPYELYAFTNEPKLAKSFMVSRCMERFYLKTKKLDRPNYNELVRHYMMCELSMYEGYCRLDKSIKPKKFKLPLTKRESTRVMQAHSIYLHEQLYHYVWDDIGVLKDKYLEALAILGYPKLQTFIYLGDNPISRSVEDSMMYNDMNIIIQEFGWSFVPEGKEG